MRSDGPVLEGKSRTHIKCPGWRKEAVFHGNKEAANRGSPIFSRSAIRCVPQPSDQGRWIEFPVRVCAWRPAVQGFMSSRALNVSSARNLATDSLTATNASMRTNEWVSEQNTILDKFVRRPSNRSGVSENSRSSRRYGPSSNAALVNAGTVLQSIRTRWRLKKFISIPFLTVCRCWSVRCALKLFVRRYS